MAIESTYPFMKESAARRAGLKELTVKFEGKEAAASESVLTDHLDRAGRAAVAREGNTFQVVAHGQTKRTTKEVTRVYYYGLHEGKLV